MQYFKYINNDQYTRMKIDILYYILYLVQGDQSRYTRYFQKYWL